MISRSYTRLLASHLELDAAGRLALLAGTALTPEKLESGDEALDTATQARIMRNALPLSGNPALGLEWGSRLPLHAHGALGALLASSQNGDEALQTLVHFQALQFPALRFHLQRSKERLLLEIRLPEEIQGEAALFLTEALVAGLSALLTQLASGNKQGMEAGFTHAAPAHTESYKEYLGARWHFQSAQNFISLPLTLATRPNPGRDAELFHTLLRHCEQSLAQRAQERHWQQKVSQFLSLHPEQRWSVQEVAQALNTSRRTLARHLHHEGTSFRELLDAELSRQALCHMRSHAQTVDDMAEALGYQDASTFRRAFRRWFGVSPGKYMESRYPA
ncbi:MAG: AraC family transcriptional regulator ligand-binding domain-containing protein [Moraxellaceae bacterium]